MDDDRTGQVAVVFASTRRDHDPTGYAAAAEAMERRAAALPGFRGIAATRGADGFGITVSYWADAASAAAWREDAEHHAVQRRGRDDCYDSYEVVVAEIARSHRWRRA